MKKLLQSLLMAGIALSLGTQLTLAQSGGASELQSRVNTLNDMGSRGREARMFPAISAQTGVSTRQLQRVRSRYPEIGTGGLAVASILARQTGRSPDEFLSRRSNGRNWPTIARDYNVPINSINWQLDSVQRNVGAMPPTGRPGPRPF